MKIAYFCLIVVLLSFFGCVAPQRVAVLENRVAAIEMDNNRKLTRKNASSKGIGSQGDFDQMPIEDALKQLYEKINDSHLISKEEYAQLRYDIGFLKEELQGLAGAIQETNHRFDQFDSQDKKQIDLQLARMDNAISKYYTKLLMLENYMGLEPSGAPVDDKPEDALGEPLEQTEQNAYSVAKKSFDDGDMENARIQFKNFIAKYPDSKHADNARYWIADSYYIDKRFAEAILEYQKVLEKYPDSNKLAAARLKQGYAFAQLGEYANARLILKELLKKYPDSQEARFATQKLKSLK